MTMEIGDTGISENLKQKMTNPFMFTFFWVFCSWNIKNILYVLYMPLKIDQSFKNLEGEWWLWSPLFVSLILVVTLPWLNNLIEFVRQKADNVLNSQLHKRKVQEFVPLYAFNAQLEAVRGIASQANTARTDERDARNEIEELNKRVEQTDELFTEEADAHDKLKLSYEKLLTWTDNTSSLLRLFSGANHQIISKSIGLDTKEYELMLKSMINTYSEFINDDANIKS